jgi:hypothetical protein
VRLLSGLTFVRLEEARSTDASTFSNVIVGAHMVTEAIALGLYVKNQKIAGAKLESVVLKALQFDIVSAPNKWTELLLTCQKN